MKKKLVAFLIGVSMIAGLAGCQNAAKNWGGDITLNLEPNQKLEMITWKDDSLWYLTKPMTEDDIAETYLFQQSSEFGVFEGTVTVVESKNIEGD